MNQSVKLDAYTLLLVIAFTPLLFNRLTTIILYQQIHRLYVRHRKPTELTYPNETNNTIRLVVYDSDREQTAEPNVPRGDITITLVEQDLPSDKENNGRLVKNKEPLGIGNPEPQVLPTDVTPPSGTAERVNSSAIISNGAVQECTSLRLPLRQILEERRPICYRSFDHLRTVDKVFDRITYLTSVSGLLIASAEK